MPNILITGGAGFIGSSLADRLARDPAHRLTLVDNLLTGAAANLPQSDNCRFIKCDVNRHDDIAPIMGTLAFDYVFHYAAMVGVKRTLDNPVTVLQDIEGIKNILGLAKNTGVRRVFYASSSEVYGEPVTLPQNEETTPLNSRLPYAIVKNVGEAYCRSYHQEYGLNYTIFRFFNTYGPRQSEDFVITRFIRRALANEPITLYGDGSQTRTFCYIDDNVAATVNTLEQDKFVNDVINIGSDQPVTILDLAKLVIDLTGSKSEIQHLPPLPEGDMTRRQPDITRAREVFPKNLTPLEEGIRRILEEMAKG